MAKLQTDSDCKDGSQEVYTFASYYYFTQDILYLQYTKHGM